MANDFFKPQADFMKRAISLAKRAEGFTNPNPLVGAVIVKDGKIIGEGYHKKYGDLHAERSAIQNCNENGFDAKGAVLYVTLEPCCHYGKQPPCTDAIVAAGISCVVVGSRDPNPLVSGRGAEILRQNHIEVIEDFLRAECDKLNEIFFYYITKGTPFVALKFAMTLDGKIATKAGNAKWISNEKSRAFVHRLRNRYAAILVGIGTVLSDDPMLNCRLENATNPVRIILDKHLRIPLESKIVKSANQIPTIVVTTKNEDQNFAEFTAKKTRLTECGVEILENPLNDDDKIDFSCLLQKLGDKKLDSVLIEGGANVNFSAIKSGFVDKIYCFIAPKIFGGNAKTPVSGEGVPLVENAFNFSLSSVTPFDDDVLLEYKKI